MPKHKRVRKLIPKLLEQGPLSTHEIYDILKARVPKNVPTMHSLTNILAKNPLIETLHHARDAGNPYRLQSICSGSYAITVWKLKNR